MKKICGLCKRSDIGKVVQFTPQHTKNGADKNVRILVLTPQESDQLDNWEGCENDTVMI